MNAHFASGYRVRVNDGSTSRAWKIIMYIRVKNISVQLMLVCSFKACSRLDIPFVLPRS